MNWVFFYKELVGAMSAASDQLKHKRIVALVPSQAGMTMCMIRTRLLGTAL